MSDTRATVETYLRAIGKHDIDTILNLTADPADWAVHGSPLVPWLGERSSHIQVSEFFHLLDTNLTPREFAVETVVVDGEEAVVLGEFRYLVNDTGREFHSTFALRLTVRDGKVVRYHMHEDSYAIHVAFEA
ncbi:hypothetical protein Afil01_12970 [Actinorhabdospora filicis]|uniref:SnoaL-like domain-containing protein n=1 Tax=Actinorhabdospora filicis TaxID=1785913 RepID=A0A9W6W9B3_9ACTN|nr:nuclear transport factor 2 family protein [Actinorhabdospora filicis]GLZ76490.1 hypothetical protein Afil01_12970 [Actinorhabdospora filicis]